MPAAPSRDSISGSGATPSNAQARDGFGKLWDWATTLLGLSGSAADARDALGVGQLISYRNLVVNGAGQFNQRVYASGTNTTSANQVTLDRWRVVTSGQSLVFGAGAQGQSRVITFPAGGAEQIIEAPAIRGGIYTLSWVGTATATVNGAAITNGGQTATLPANTAVTLRLSGGTGTDIQFELGGVKTAFEQRPPAIELLLCQRDCAKSYALATAPGSATTVGRYVAGGNAGGYISYTVRLPVAMRTAPSTFIWDTNSNANSVITTNSAGTGATRAAVTSNATESTFEIYTSAAGTDLIMSGQWLATTGF